MKYVKQAGRRFLKVLAAATQKRALIEHRHFLIKYRKYVVTKHYLIDGACPRELFH